MLVAAGEGMMGQAVPDTISRTPAAVAGPMNPINELTSRKGRFSTREGG
ncbi:MAG TPA: hypothetical protein VHK00_04640 [Miltoncostaeaceae bacterium]|nr:hypothetical protein [Miltoncostaeaceae bacterium]